MVRARCSIIHRISSWTRSSLLLAGLRHSLRLGVSVVSWPSSPPNLRTGSRSAFPFYSLFLTFFSFSLVFGFIPFEAGKCSSSFPFPSITLPLFLSLVLPLITFPSLFLLFCFLLPSLLLSAFSQDHVSQTSPNQCYRPAWTDQIQRRKRSNGPRDRKEGARGRPDGERERRADS